MATGQDDGSGTRLGGGEKTALGAALLWALVAGLVLLSSGRPADVAPDPLRGILAILALALPGGLVLLGISANRAGRRAAAEAARVTAAAEALRALAVAERQSRAATPAARSPEPARVAEPAQPKAAVVPFQTRRPAAAAARATSQPSRPAAVAEQRALDLGLVPEAADAAPMEVLIVALNFPETADDREGFRALRRAMKDPRTSRLIRAAQDVLTLLSQDGLYMDDLAPDRARPEIWRRFAGGERGRTVAALGGIRDRSALTISADRMRADAIFRDTAHHFIRTFDRAFAALEPEATDTEIARLTDTRTARAFMLLGRAAGIFD